MIETESPVTTWEDLQRQANGLTIQIACSEFWGFKSSVDRLLEEKQAILHRMKELRERCRD